MNNFDSVYKLAIAKDEEGLKRLSPQCLDEFKTGDIYMSAAGQLAMEGKFEAVDLLIRLGANINFIAYGAARGGHRNYAEALRLRGANVNRIAKGAAMGGHRDYAEELRTKHRAKLSNIAFGAAAGGHHDYVEELRTKHQASAEDIAFGAAYAGNRDYAEKNLILDGNDQVSLASRVAFCAAQGGHFEYTEWLRLNLLADTLSIAKGAARGGYRDYAEKLRSNYKLDANLIANSSARSGHRDYAEELRTKHEADVYEIVGGAANGGHSDYVEELRTNHQRTNPRVTDNYIAEMTAYGGNRDYALKLRTQGVDINRIAFGALQGAHLEYAEELRRSGADPTQLARYAARFGHLLYAEELRIKHGANANDVAMVAAYYGHRDYAEKLRTTCELDITQIAAAAAKGDYHEYAEELRTEHRATRTAGNPINGKLPDSVHKVPHAPNQTIPSSNNDLISLSKNPEFAALEKRLSQAEKEITQLRNELAKAKQVTSDTQKPMPSPSRLNQPATSNPQGPINRSIPFVLSKEGEQDLEKFRASACEAAISFSKAAAIKDKAAQVLKASRSTVSKQPGPIVPKPILKPPVSFIIPVPTPLSLNLNPTQGVTGSKIASRPAEPLDKDFEQATKKIADLRDTQPEANSSIATNGTHKRKRSDDEEVDTGREVKRKKEEATNPTESALLTDRNTFFAPVQDDVMIVDSTGPSELAEFAHIAIKTEPK